MDVILSFFSTDDRIDKCLHYDVSNLTFPSYDKFRSIKRKSVSVQPTLLFLLFDENSSSPFLCSSR